MPWTPLIPIRGIEQICDNLGTVIGRDQAAALLWANDGSPLEAFAIVGRAIRADVRFPFVNIFPRNTRSTVANEGAAIKQQHQIWVEVACIGPEPQLLAHTIMRYLRAVNQMVISASNADMIAGFIPGNVSDPIWDVTQIDYRVDVRDLQDNQYVHSGRLLVEIQIWEGS